MYYMTCITNYVYYPKGNYLLYIPFHKSLPPRLVEAFSFRKWLQNSALFLRNTAVQLTHGRD